jgi:hypothetical protein
MSIPERRLLLSINAAKSLINPVAKQPESEPMIGPAATYQMADALIECQRGPMLPRSLRRLSVEPRIAKGQELSGRSWDRLKNLRPSCGQGQKSYQKSVRELDTVA